MEDDDENVEETKQPTDPDSKLCRKTYMKTCAFSGEIGSRFDEYEGLRTALKFLAGNKPERLHRMVRGLSEEHLKKLLEYTKIKKLKINGDTIMRKMFKPKLSQQYKK